MLSRFAPWRLLANRVCRPIMSSPLSKCTQLKKLSVLQSQLETPTVSPDCQPSEQNFWQQDVSPSDFESADFGSVESYANTLCPPHEAFTLSPVTYKSTRFFEEEKKKVFGKSWVCIGTVDQVKNPGDTIVAELAGQPIFAVRDKKNSLNAFFNVCRHRGSKLIRKSGRNAVISCPYHRWGYSLDGKLLATPLWDTVEGGKRFNPKTNMYMEKSRAKKSRCDVQEKAEIVDAATAARREVVEAEQMALSSSDPSCSADSSLHAAFDTAHIKAFDKNDFPLFKVRVGEWGPFVFATLSGEEELGTLETVLGEIIPQLSSYPLSELVTVRSTTYESKCNWKLLAENFMEYMHLPSVHPALVTVSSVDSHRRQQGRGQYIGFITHPLSKGGQPIDPGTLPPMPGLSGDELETGVFHHCFPNAFYFLLPSHIFCVRMIPISPTLTLEVANLMVHPSLLRDADAAGESNELNTKLDDIMNFYDMTNREDIDICENVQDGVQTKAYLGGRISFRFEETIHRFQNILIDYMTCHGNRVPFGDKEIPYYVSGQPDKFVDSR